MFIFSVAWHRGDEDSPKRQGGLWPFVTFIGVIVGIMGLMSNILFLGDYKDDRSIYEEGNYDRPMSFARDMFIHGAAGLLCILIVCAEVEVTFVLNAFQFLRSFFARGVTYFFIGIMTYDATLEGHHKFEDHQYNAVCTLSILGLGAFYIAAAFALDLSPSFLGVLLKAQGLQQGRQETPAEL